VQNDKLAELCAPASLPLGHWPCDRIKNIGAGMFKLDGTYSKGARFPASAPEGVGCRRISCMGVVSRKGRKADRHKKARTEVVPPRVLP